MFNVSFFIALLGRLGSSTAVPVIQERALTVRCYLNIELSMPLRTLLVLEDKGIVLARQGLIQEVL
ncbi:hypothetical protein [Vibrio parahaemolyticus]|uniref:hypothetical protein n=1 Tax=Vibrio parahaemolyticus TaxID=670 RepID=UPI0023606ED7|nr:hypothetical protein [Vibrio parahaemolyticus]